MIMVVYGIGATLGGQILGYVSDNKAFNGSKTVSQVNVVLHVIIYGSLFLCNEVHEYNFLCFFAGFWIGAADSSMMTQIQVIASSYFAPNSGQVCAILNVIKTISISLMIFVASFVSSKEGFRWFFGFQIVVNVIGQLVLLTKFDFKLKEEDTQLTPLGPGEQEMQII